MKKLVSVGTALALVMGAAGCGGSSSNSELPRMPVAKAGDEKASGADKTPKKGASGPVPVGKGDLTD